MKNCKFIISLLIVICFACSVKSTYAQNSSIEKEVIELSSKKWQWMADKDVDKLETLFHDRAKFVHMSGSWKKDRELEAFGIKRLMYMM